jgi:lipoprotein-anchoring transpeptidase ErfK/SrfK
MVAAAAGALALVIGVPALTGGKVRSEALPVRAAAPTTTSTTLPQIRLAAVARIPAVAVYGSPEDPKPVRLMANPTIEHIPLVFLAKEQLGQWLHVQLPVRPNQSMGWIRAADVNATPVHTRIVVESAAHKLTVFQDDTPVLEAPVAVGTGGTPTPTGSFYIDAVVKLNNPNTVWGPYQLSVTGFSDVLRTFGGGQGQIAIHGTNAPGLIGGNVSHGCVRMQNPDITKVAALIGLATPVEIRA